MNKLQLNWPQESVVQHRKCPNGKAVALITTFIIER